MVVVPIRLVDHIGLIRYPDIDLAMTGGEMVDVYAERRQMNNKSKAWAKRDGKPWSKDEDDFITEFWVDVDHCVRDEVTVSQIVERTIESCRVRAEKIRKSNNAQIFMVHKTTTTYLGVKDDPDDEWWSADYYNGK